MKKIIMTGALLSAAYAGACRNTISNNTNETYKIAEIRQENKDLKKELYLPDNYLKDEQKAHTLKPGEEVSFGGHYLPTFAIFKEYPDKKWHSLLIVKQNECGPRGPENKYLLLTDLLKCKLPDDYNPVYTFVRRKIANELITESKNAPELTAVANPYQELQNILDEMVQKIQELMSRLIDRCSACMTPAARTASTAYSSEENAPEKDAVSQGEGEKEKIDSQESGGCSMCAAYAAPDATSEKTPQTEKAASVISTDKASSTTVESNNNK